MRLNLRVQLALITLLRIVLNTMHRMVYPFLTIFAGGLGVDVATLSFALTGRNLVGIFGPIFAPVADRRGRKFGMLAGLSTFTLGVGLVAIHPGLATLSAALILALLGKSMFDPAMQAYFGDRIAYDQRGTAFAITEMSWSLAFIAGVPLMGLLIAHFSWPAPFPVLAALGLAMLALIVWMIPNDRTSAAGSLPANDSNRKPSSLRAILTSIPALACVSIALWASAANEMVNLIFGVWLSDSFGLQIAALAGASAVIGLAELSGEGLVALFTDRIGKPRAVALGLAANIAASILLPFIGRTESGALIGLFLFYISFEYMVVSQLPLVNEVVPQARATMMAFNLVGFGIGRSLGALLSTIIYQKLGFPSVTVLATMFNLFALLALAEMQQKITLLPHLMAWTAKCFSRTARSD